ncbi:hypothetical protein DL765_007664 [Monosporascus sp. GIB2]|nr:hypothetical protein DL765_007664 [Monosporascus sp. GIB2]
MGPDPGAQLPTPEGDTAGDTGPPIDNGRLNGGNYNGDPELDGDDTDPVAICGFSFKFPQDATSADGLWRMMLEKRCAMTDFPHDRINPGGFQQRGNKLNTIPLGGGHFIKEDLSVFDADFFSISPAEATAMDPMQRWLLEAAYRALENAGITMENVSGSSTAVYTGSFAMDYMLQLHRDPECPPTYAAVGFGLSMLANRLSWFYNLRGPSIGLDSACSSTAMAIDIACQALRNKSCDMPSREAQERLIRDTYSRAGLSLAHTRYFEAHGTGTPIGDPREAQAIGTVFQDYRTNLDPVYVGAIKSNIGHLEGASGLAGVIKAVLVLEKGIIPPNANFEELNPKIDAEFLRLRNKPLHGRR